MREAFDWLVPARLIQESDMKRRQTQVYVYLIERVSQPQRKRARNISKKESEREGQTGR